MNKIIYHSKNDINLLIKRVNRKFYIQILVLGLRDYIEKNNFPGVVIGISGGIDSAFSACVAVEALGSV